MLATYRRDDVSIELIQKREVYQDPQNQQWQWLYEVTAKGAHEAIPPVHSAGGISVDSGAANNDLQSAEEFFALNKNQMVREFFNRLRPKD